ncbi:DUF2924 domain-containing protein [Wolbachia endosymbiont of Pentalonia nigronervosa]|uniref:DUF2924 domain-containing protein n=1 Tax=Wolbachia endosymbiont of Pentalonia nigronervosa TaxID=1301914 RepID=UPI00165F237C|nr:DUF2924 domain-containing protein [Wolbachia endosymbiont of Pentalonia nigronervosa]MBD0392073.1 DUF2924 domain-containing protein [Wolbachia endosymbiont of Pentalonia nigronervosa]
MSRSTEQEVLSLTSKSLPEIKKIWRQLFESEAPPYCRKYLIPRIAYRLQEVKYGKLSGKVEKRVDQLADQMEEGKKIKGDNLPVSGTKFIREYNGEDHEVLVTDKGFIYQGQFFKSLSAIAEKITGTNWNGPAFFSLRDKRKNV